MTNQENKKTNHGGARKGAGRPKTGRKKTMGITLDAADIDFLKAIGGSRWIRKKLAQERENSSKCN